MADCSPNRIDFSPLNRRTSSTRMHLFFITQVYSSPSCGCFVLMMYFHLLHTTIISNFSIFYNLENAGMTPEKNAGMTREVSAYLTRGESTENHDHLLILG